ncbi:TPA: recombinase RecT, partial [Yersinia enterocolitica]|nr:recombinase RecT [Yersinia enterocolitica]
MSFSIVEFVKQQEPLFSSALTDQGVTWAKESQFAVQLFQRNEYLTKTAIANPASAQNAIINVAAIGITLNPASKLAYLVPRDGMVCLDISYMGLLHLAQATGAIKWGQCKLVYSNDTYESNGLDSAPTHKYNTFGDRGTVVGG